MTIVINYWIVVGRWSRWTGGTESKARVKCWLRRLWLR